MSRASILVGAAAALAVSLLAPAGAHALTYTVDTNADIAGFGTCSAAPSDCSLRQAVQQANSTPAADEIVLTVSPQLSIPGSMGGDDQLNASDDIDVNGTSGGALTIRSDTGMRTISRQTGATNFRIIDAFTPLTLEDVEITGGNLTTNVTTGGGGVHFLAASPQTLRLDNAFIHDNAVGSGATLARGGGVSAGVGQVEIVGGSRIEGNDAANGIASSMGAGGGVAVTGGADLTVSGATIEGNTAGSGNGPTQGFGGGIFVANDQPTTSFVTVTNSQVDMNRAGGLGATSNVYSGGGIFAEASAPGAAVDVSLTGGSLSGNTVGGGSGNSNGNGGGARVALTGSASGGELTLDGVAVTGNRAGGSEGMTNPTTNNVAQGLGAGVYTNVDTTVTDSVISDNRAGVAEAASGLSFFGSGAGIYTEDFSALTPDLTVTGSRIEDNFGGQGINGGGQGGGIQAGNEGALVISSSVLAGNRATGGGGGISRFITGTGTADSVTDTSITGNQAAQAGGGITLNTPRVFTINRSLVEGNSATSLGGGIDASSEPAASPVGKLRLLNSTVTGNTTGLDTPTGSLLPIGGGIAIGANDETDFEAAFSTIAANTVFRGSSTSPTFGRGGNIHFFDDANAVFTGTIVSGGAATGPSASAPNCSLGIGVAITSNGGNLEGPDSAGSPTTSCGFTNTPFGDQAGVNPLLAALADNGGPTRTRALPAGSPAIDAVPPAVCTATTLTTDQRGFARPFPAGGACDSGAYELRDSDGDGLLDTSDNCPSQSGPASNGGCPLPVATPTPVTPKCPKGKKLKVVKGKRKCVKKKKKKKRKKK